METKSIRKENSILNSEELKRKELVLKSRPRMVFLELTRSCNLYCTMCRPHKMIDSKLDMSEEVLKKFEEELVPYIECVDLRGWGESTLDDRLVPLIDKMNENNISVNLYTNLTTRDGQYWKEMLSKNVNIAISIENRKEERYLKFRRGASYDKLLENLQAIKEIIETGVVTNLPFFTTVVSEENLDDLIDLVELASEYKIPRLQLNPITKNFEKDNIKYQLKGVPEEQLSKLNQTLALLKEKGEECNVEIEIAANLFETNDVDLKQCIHPWSYVFMRFDGAIGFCDHLIAHNGSILGNILDKPFMDIWNSEEYVKVRDVHINKDFDYLKCKNIECKWCYENRYGNCEYYFEKEYKPMELSSYIEKCR